jgi:hypothetical protein
MPMALANALLVLVAAYLAAGVAFAVVLHAGGLARVDANAARGSRGFRIVVTPGLILLWPVLLGRWRRGVGMPPAPRDAHRDAARRGRER